MKIQFAHELGGLETDGDHMLGNSFHMGVYNTQHLWFALFFIFTGTAPIGFGGVAAGG
jgi:hypothetical protein